MYGEYVKEASKLSFFFVFLLYSIQNAAFIFQNKWVQFWTQDPSYQTNTIGEEE